MPAGMIVKETSIALTSTTANILAGSQFALLTEPSVISVGVTGNVTGLLVTINCGNRIIAESFAPPVATVMPVIPDNFFFTFPGLPGETIQITVQNTTGAGITVRAVVQIATA